LLTSATCKFALLLKANAAAPETWGHAIEVPEMDLVSVSLRHQHDLMAEPGAKMSRHLPQLEKEDLASTDVVDPTVMAAGTNAGLNPHASLLLLPAATTTVTPYATAASMADV